MKKSEYEAARRAAAEAAGVVWDPEEEPLPVALYNLEGWIGVKEGVNFRELTWEERGEVVRRWNAWPELRRLLVTWSGEVSSVELDERLLREMFAILGGKGGA